MRDLEFIPVSASDVSNESKYVHERVESERVSSMSLSKTQAMPVRRIALPSLPAPSEADINPIANLVRRGLWDTYG